jgi:hypothetical protein
MEGWFNTGAKGIAEGESARGVGGVVHGDYKLDNLVSAGNHRCDGVRRA